MDNSTVVDWLLEQSAKAYESERDFTARLRDRAGFILGFLITPIGGAIISLLTTFKGDIFEKYNFIFFTVPLFLASLAMGFALSKILRFLRKTTSYRAPLTPKQLLTYYNEGTNAEDSFLHTKQVMAKTLSDAVEENIKINSHRLKELIDCQKLAVYAVPLIIFCSVKYFHASYTHRPSAIDVNLINVLGQTKGSPMSNQSDSSNNKPASSPAPSKPLLPDPPRSAPATRSVLDHAEKSDSRKTYIVEDKKTK